MQNIPPPPPGFTIDTSPMFQQRPVYRQRPPAPAPQTPAQAEKDRLDAVATDLNIRNTREQMQERRDKKAQEAQMLDERTRTATDDILRVVQRMDRVAVDAHDNGGWGETGTTGKIMRALPFSSAGYDLQRDLDLIGANAAIETLMQMRRESPTGAGVGNVALGELQLMKDKYGTFDPNQGHESFLRNLAEGKQEFLDKLKRINPQAYQQYLKSGSPGIWLAKDGSFKIGSVRQGGPPPREEMGEIEFLGFEDE